MKDLPPHIQRPNYKLEDVKVGVLHFGPSFFFRGHLAVYLNDLLNEGHMDWGVCAVGLRSSRLSELKKQNYLYSVIEEGKDGTEYKVIGSLRETMSTETDGKRAIIERMLDPNIKLVTMTITQFGYHYRPDTILDWEHEDVKASLENIDEPTITVGFIVAALKGRMERGIPPFSVMSCDNFPNNAEILKFTVLAYAREVSKELRDWIATNVSFQGTMVDRIVPSKEATKHKRDYHHHTLGMVDICPIFTEPFRQFVISEPKEGVELPPLEKVGAKIVNNVDEYELTKIRTLNGVHMALGLFGRLVGCGRVDEAMSKSRIKEFAQGFMEEVGQTLPEIEGMDLDRYREDIVNRLENPHMGDELVRLARDGLKKIPDRVVAPLQDLYAKGGPIETRKHLLLSFAMWIEYLARAGRDSGFDISDKAAVAHGLTDVAAELDSDPTPFLMLDEIQNICRVIPNSVQFIDELREVYAALDDHLKAAMQDSADHILGQDNEDAPSLPQGPKNSDREPG